MACEDRKVSSQDLRLKLQKKSLPQQSSQSGKGSGVRDLREKLSGTMNSQPVNADPPKRNLEVAKPARKSVTVEAPEPEIKKVASVALKTKSQQKACIYFFFLQFLMRSYVSYAFSILFT